MKKDRYIEKTKIKGIYIIHPHKHEDARGLFVEAFTISLIENLLKRKIKFKAWNHSRSNPRVIRGLHAEDTEKLIYPNSGTVFLALADIRSDSKTFGKHIELTISPDNPISIFIESGIAVGFCSQNTNKVDYQYLMTNEYSMLISKGIRWDDPDLNIKWPIKNPILSERDSTNPSLRQLFPRKYIK